jgi:hypothetical protein
MCAQFDACGTLAACTAEIIGPDVGTFLSMPTIKPYGRETMKRKNTVRDSQDARAQSETRDKFRDNDDVRDPLSTNERTGIAPDTRNEARGDARENVGNVARGTDATPSGPEGNDRQRGRPGPDAFDADLEKDNRRKG